MLKMVLKAIVLTFTPNPNSNVCEKIERKKKKTKQRSLPLFWFVAILYRIQYMLKVALKTIILTLTSNTNSYVCHKTIETNKNKSKLKEQYYSLLVFRHHNTHPNPSPSNTNSCVGCEMTEKQISCLYLSFDMSQFRFLYNTHYYIYCA